MFLAFGSGAAFACVFAFAFVFERNIPAAAVIGLLCIIGGFALRAQSIGGQIFARGAIWSSAVFQLLFLHILSSDYPHGTSSGLLWGSAGCVIAAALSLYLAGRPEPQTSSRFQPVAHFGTLTAALILAVADTLSLLFWGSMAAQGHAMETAAALIACGALMGIGVYGLFRMRTWALFLNLFSNILIASIAALGLIDVGPLALVLIATAGLQLVVAMPIVASILRPELQAPAWVLALQQRIPAVALFTLAALALQPLLGESMLVQVARWAGY
jgi:hypothetical protein